MIIKVCVSNISTNLSGVHLAVINLDLGSLVSSRRCHCRSSSSSSSSGAIWTYSRDQLLLFRGCLWLRIVLCTMASRPLRSVIIIYNKRSCPLYSWQALSPACLPERTAPPPPPPPVLPEGIHPSDSKQLTKNTRDATSKQTSIEWPLQSQRLHRAAVSSRSLGQHCPPNTTTTTTTPASSAGQLVADTRVARMLLLCLVLVVCCRMDTFFWQNGVEGGTGSRSFRQEITPASYGRGQLLCIINHNAATGERGYRNAALTYGLSLAFTR